MCTYTPLPSSSLTDCTRTREDAFLPLLPFFELAVAPPSLHVATVSSSSRGVVSVVVSVDGVASTFLFFDSKILNVSLRLALSETHLLLDVPLRVLFLSVLSTSMSLPRRFIRRPSTDRLVKYTTRQKEGCARWSTVIHVPCWEGLQSPVSGAAAVIR